MLLHLNTSHSPDDEPFSCYSPQVEAQGSSLCPIKHAEDLIVGPTKQDILLPQLQLPVIDLFHGYLIMWLVKMLTCSGYSTAI